MNYISSYLSIKQDSLNSSDYFVTFNKVYLDQKVETIVLSKLPRDQITAKSEAMQIADRSNHPFFINRLAISRHPAVDSTESSHSFYDTRPPH